MRSAGLEGARRLVEKADVCPERRGGGRSWRELGLLPVGVVAVLLFIASCSGADRSDSDAAPASSTTSTTTTTENLDRSADGPADDEPLGPDTPDAQDRGPDLDRFVGGDTDTNVIVLGDRGELSVIDVDGGDPTLLREGGQGAAASQPVWSPDGRFVAWTELDDRNIAGVVVATNDGSSRRRFPVTSPPFYLSWDPAGSGVLALLGNAIDAPGLQLSLLDVFTDGALPVAVDAGTPLYTAWDPAGGRLAMHIGLDGNRVVKVADAMAARVESDSLFDGGFTAPVWLPAGEGGDEGPLYSVARLGEGDRARQDLVRVDVEAGEMTAAVDVGDGAWLVAESDGVGVLVQTPVGLAATAPEPGVVQVGSVLGGRQTAPKLGLGLHRLDTASGALEQVLEEPTFAFFANPVDRRSLVFLGPHSDRPSPEWAVLDERGGVTATFPLIPSEAYVNNYLPFSDQFAQSVRHWSPDGRRFVVTGREADGIDGVWVVEASGEVVPQRVADGIIAFWSP